MGFVYLIHLDTKLAHAEHYLGYAESDIEERLKRHRSGQGSKMLAACNRKKINYSIVRHWSEVDRNFERKLKNNSHIRKHCPVCREKDKIVKQ